MYNILIGGAAGLGIDTTAAVLEKLIKRSGYNVFTVRDFMSRIRGGHNFMLLRFGTDPVLSHSDHLDGIIAMDKETITEHIDKLKRDGFILCDYSVKTDDSRTIALDMSTIAKDLGNPRVAGTISVGAVLKLFAIPLDHIEDVFRSFLKEQYVDVNVKAIHKGHSLVDSRYVFNEGQYADWMILSGTTATAMGAIAAGINFYSAYPMSPSTGILETLASHADKAGIVVEQAEDEIAAINMALGASFAGARAMTGTSGGGFSLKVEALGLAGIAEIPLVVFNVQRPGPATGLPTRTEQSDLKFVISAAQGEFPRIVIALRNASDAFYQTIRAAHLAEKYQIPVIVLSDQFVGDASFTTKPFDLSYVSPVKPGTEKIDTDDYKRYEYSEDGISPRLIPGKTGHLVMSDSDEHDEYGFITESAEVRTLQVDKRMKKLEGIRLELVEPDFIGPENFDTLLIGWGSTWGPISEAVSLLNSLSTERYAALVFGDVYPLPQKLLLDKASIAKRIVNVEQNATGQLAALIRQETGILCGASILKYDGRQLSGEEIADRITKEVLV